MHWKKISEIVGFTDTEFKIILFLVSIFLCGVLLTYFNTTAKKLTDFDYSVSDSVFLSSDITDSIEGNEAQVKSIISFADNKNFSIKKGKPEEYSIDINIADLKELMRLPGIGEKTAHNIIEYRVVHKFNTPEDLILVKGISTAKFNKVKKYIFVK